MNTTTKDILRKIFGKLFGKKKGYSPGEEGKFEGPKIGTVEESLKKVQEAADLRDAIEGNNVEKVKTLIENTPSLLKFKYADDSIPLQIAVKENKLSVARVLLYSKELVKEQVDEGYDIKSLEGLSEDKVKELTKELTKKVISGYKYLKPRDYIKDEVLSKDTAGNTVLHGFFSVDWGSTLRDADGLLQTLLQEGAQFGVKNKEGKNPLHFLAANRCWYFGWDEEGSRYQLLRQQLLSTLIKTADAMGHDWVKCNFLKGLGEKDNDGNTPIALAEKKGGGNFAKWLISLPDVIDTSVNFFNKLREPLTPLLSEQYLEALQQNLKELVIKGADVNVLDKEGNTPLHSAVLKGDTKIVELLLAKKANINGQNIDGNPPLHLAIQKGKSEMALFLLKNGAGFNTQNQMGESPLQLAKTMSEKKLKNLLQHLDDLHGAVSSGQVEKVKKLIEQMKKEDNGYVNAKDLSGNTLLNKAAQLGNLDMVKFLLEEGADPDATNNAGRTLLHLAAEAGKLEVVEWLMEPKKSESGEEKRVVNINAQDEKGDTALHAAVRAFVEHLIKFKTNSEDLWNEADFRKRLSELLKIQQTVKYFLKQGADVTIENNERQAPKELMEALMGKSGIENIEDLLKGGKKACMDLLFAFYHVEERHLVKPPRKVERGEENESVFKTQKHPNQ